MSSFSSLSSSTLSVGALLLRDDTRLSVANWQRQYAWDEATAEQFVGSLWHASTPIANNSRTNAKEYFIGCIYTSQEAGVTRLLDGQQRLTTCMLAIAVAMSMLTSDTISTGPRNVSTTVAFGRLLFHGITGSNDADNMNFGNATRLVLGAADQRLFSHILHTAMQRSVVGAGLGDTDAKSRMMKVFLALKEQMTDNCAIVPPDTDTNKRLCDFLDFLRDRVFVMNVVVPTVEMAVAVFSSINRPSIPLNDSDIFLAEMMKIAPATKRDELRTRFDVLRTALEPGHLAMLAGIVRTVMLSRCMLIAMQRVAQGTRHTSPETCATLRSFEESAPHEFFRYLFDYMSQVKSNKLSLFASGLQLEDQWASVFDVFEALGLGMRDLLAQSSRISFLRVISLDVRIALRGQSPWLLTDDNRPSFQAIDVDATWLACIVLLSTLEQHRLNVRLLGECLSTTRESTPVLCAMYEQLLLDCAKKATTAPMLSDKVEIASKTFLEHVLRPLFQPLSNNVMDSSYLMTFGATSKPFRWLCRFLLQRYADLVANSQMDRQLVRNVWREYQIEHICPRTVEATSDWSRLFQWTKDNAEIDRLGNLTLVTDTENASMGNDNWSQKRVVLLSLPLGCRIVENEWTVVGASNRRKLIVDTLIRDWNASTNVTFKASSTSQVTNAMPAPFSIPTIPIFSFSSKSTPLPPTPLFSMSSISATLPMSIATPTTTGSMQATFAAPAVPNIPVAQPAPIDPNRCTAITTRGHQCTQTTKPCRFHKK
jgi:hypothetical protein